MLNDATPERQRKLPVHVEAWNVREVVELERRRLGPREQLDQLVAADRRNELPGRGVGTHRDRAAGRNDDDGPLHAELLLDRGRVGAELRCQSELLLDPLRLATAAE